jgi:pimeloyl-ACP methyl ester carboxylesterase
MDRRNFATHASAALAGAALSACGGADAMGTNPKPTFVFVHGAWHGGWCWAEVVRLLAEQGYGSLVVDLPGHGVTARMPVSYTSKPQNLAALSTEVSALAAVTPTDYRDHVLKIIRGLVAGGSGPVILVGHSVGGLTLSPVAEAEPSMVRKLVYLTAYVPVRLAVLEYLNLPEFATAEVVPLFVADPLVVGAARINFDSADASYRAKLKSAFYGDLSDGAFAAAANLLTPDYPAGLLAAVTVTAQRWGSVPRAFIRCTNDHAIPLAAQDLMIRQADAFTPGNAFVQKTLTTSHSPFISAPADLVGILASLAA